MIFLTSSQPFRLVFVLGLPLALSLRSLMAAQGPAWRLGNKRWIQQIGQHIASTGRLAACQSWTGERWLCQGSSTPVLLVSCGAGQEARTSKSFEKQRRPVLARLAVHRVTSFASQGLSSNSSCYWCRRRMSTGQYNTAPGLAGVREVI